MRTVLIIGGFFPYCEGSRRVVGLAKYLPEYEWQPVILTMPLRERPEDTFRVIEAPYKPSLSPVADILQADSDRMTRERIREKMPITSKRSVIDILCTLVGEVVNYPDAYKYWKHTALAAGEGLLRSEDVDAVISIWPVTAHVVARELKIKYGIPWIADFPDLWSQNHNYSYSRLRRLRDEGLERRTVAEAGALVTVSEPWAEKLRALHAKQRVWTVPHGFDPERVNDPPVKLTAKFTITYSGTIYAGKQDPTKLLVAVRELISEGAMNRADIEGRFYGEKQGWLEKDLVREKLSDIFKQYGAVSMKCAMEKQRESQVLLLLRWENPTERGFHTGKVYEYLGARRPILATGGFPDVIEKLLRETKAGMCAASAWEIKDAINRLYGEYKLKGEVAFRGDEMGLNEYSEREMARKFSQILNVVTDVGRMT